jgi:hypothetical protein
MATCSRCGLPVSPGVCAPPPRVFHDRPEQCIEALRKAFDWEDVRDEWSARISAAHPTRSESHDAWTVAMQMVGHRHSKGQLVALVNWLLVLCGRTVTARAELATARDAAIEEAAVHVGNHCCVSSCCDAQPGMNEARVLADCIRALKSAAPKGGG